MRCMKYEWMFMFLISEFDYYYIHYYCTLQATNISPKKGTFEDDFPFPKVGYVSFLAGNIPSNGLKPPTIVQVSTCPDLRRGPSIPPFADEAGLNGTSKTARGYNHMTIQES